MEKGRYLIQQYEADSNLYRVVRYGGPTGGMTNITVPMQWQAALTCLAEWQPGVVEKASTWTEDMR